MQTFLLGYFSRLLIFLRFRILINKAIFGYREQRVFTYSWIATLIKCVNFNIQSLVLSDYSLRVMVRIERIHKNERHIYSVGFI